MQTEYLHYVDVHHFVDSFLSPAQSSPTYEVRYISSPLSSNFCLYNNEQNAAFRSVYMYNYKILFFISHKPSWAGCSPAGEINEIKNLIDLLIDGYIDRHKYYKIHTSVQN